MIEMDFIMWNQFEQSGKIDDYLAYKATSEDLNEEQENAYNN